MGRNIGTNVYSNNFEPQVNGLLDARGQAATKADLTTTAQWISTDGNIYAPKAILVAVTDDPIASNNGLYMLKGNDYSVASNWMQINVENTPSNVKVLTTANLINNSRTNAVQLSSTDVSTLRSATDKDVFVYNGALGGMTTTIPMTITFTSSPATALQMVISYAFVDKTFYIVVSATDTSQKNVLYADVPREMANGGGGSSTSNVKVLTTPSLLDTTRTSSIDLSAADAAILTGLSVGKDMVVYGGMSGVASQFIPLSVNMVGSWNAKVFLVSFAFYNSLYYFNINGGMTSNKYTAGAINRAEGSGGGGIEKISIPFDTIYNLAVNSSTTSADIIAGIGQDKLDKLCDLNLPLDVELTNFYGNGSIFAKKSFMMGDSSTLAVSIATIQNQMFVLNNNSGEYTLSILPQIEFDSTIEPSSNNAPQNKAVNEALKAKQATLVSGTNIKTINGNSILGQGNLVIEGGGASAAEIVELPSDASTNLPYENGYYDGNSQDFANKIREISNNPTKIYMLKYSPTGYYTIINPYIDSIYMGFYVDTNDGVLHFYTSDDTNNDDYTIKNEGSVYVKQDTLVSGKNIKTINGKSILGSGNIDISGSGGADVLKVSLYDLQPISGTYTVSLGDYSYDSIIALHDSRSSGKVMYVYEFNGEMGMFNISINDLDDYTFYLDYLNKKIKVEYSINGDNTITCIVTDVTKHDLSIDVKAGYDGIYYRIREVVPNGYIHFVRKKKQKYYSTTQNKWFNQTTYSPMGLSFGYINVGVSASKLTPNVWYKYPITNEELVNTYTAGSKNPEGVIVTYDMYKFSGNTHAKPIFFYPNGGTIGSKRTTVLNAGLQYNVLDSSFVSNTSAKTIFRQRGDIRKIDVRLSVNSINTFSSGYKLIYAIK